MENRKVLKERARKSVKSHYFRNVLLVFLASIIIAGGYDYVTNIFDSKPIINSERGNIALNIPEAKKNDIEVIDEFLNKHDTAKEDTTNKKYNRGVLAVFFNQISENDSFIFGTLNAINHFLFKGNVSVLITSLVAVTISFAIYLLVQNVIIIGRNRYFLEQRKYRNTKIDKLLFPYKVRKTLHLAKILFIRIIYQFLWDLTIIGGIIKHYEYIMIPYVLAENPNLSKKEAFMLTKEMTYGEKFNIFKLDLSFLGWKILAAFTFNLTSIFYFDIYQECTYAELYMNLRNKVKNKYPKLLNDTYLDIEDEKEEEYPKEGYKIPFKVHRKWLNIDYRRNYSVTNYILFFFSFSMVGWIYEVVLGLVNGGEFINRGTMIGPWLPIYGYGGILILLLLKPFREKPWLIFLLSFILCGIVEYGTAWYLEAVNGMRWWDYSGYFMNIQGRICLEGLLVFGLGGCGFTYLFAPLLDNIFNNIKPKIKIIICSILLICYGVDFVYSTINPNTGYGITTNYD